MIDRYARERMKAIWTDAGKYDRWLAVEIAACEAWAKLGTIPADDMAKICAARWDQARLDEKFRQTKHDVTAFLYSVTSGLGPEGRWIHLGLTSNDVWDTATALQLRDSAAILLADVDEFIDVLAKQALAHRHTLIMGRTHGVHAEPTTFGLKLALWLDEMRRNRRRLVEAAEQVAVGKISGVVGTHATVPLEVEEEACKALGIGMAPLSNQIVQRDRHAYFIATLAVIAASLEKFATEIRGLQRTEIHEVEEPFGEGQTGSSAMPHKRNPDLSERVCGLARLIRGFAVTALENVALWHERDISHSSAERIVFPDACMALDYILHLFTGVIRDLRVFPKRMMENIESTRGIVFSQRVMLALIEKGMAREEAYRTMQRHAATSWEQGADFRDLVRRDAAVQARLSGEELAALFDYGYYTRHVDALFARAGITSKENARASVA
ncbi:MAG: adenylosuccinate lyase [SAR202 cluster bacterium]|nr:adenylosuccinate lyase [SAR202 cluster bacterium]